MKCQNCKTEFNKTSNNQKFCSKSCFSQHRRKYLTRKAREYREIKTKNLEKFIGNSCFICGSKDKLTFHEKNGKNHETESRKLGISDLKYIELHKKDFIRLCKKHHRIITLIIANFKKSDYEKLLSLLIPLK